MSDLSVNPTRKFAVLDMPGVQQATTDAAESNRDGTPHLSSAPGLQGRRANVESGPRMEASKGQSHIGGDSYTRSSEFLKTRLAIYNRIQVKRQEELAQKVPVDIHVTMPDGTTLAATKSGQPFQAWITTPYDVAAVISQGLADDSTVARVTYESFVDDYDIHQDGMGGKDIMEEDEEEQEEGAGGTSMPCAGGEEEATTNGGDEATSKTTTTFLWDMSRPLVGNVAKLELLKFDDENEPDGKTCFWHSSAHVLGEALERTFGSKLTIGPPLDNGFFYDAYMGSDTLKEGDYKAVETEVNKIIKEKQKFERLVITKEEGLELFADNPFKVQILTNKVPDNSRTTVYRCGDLIDLCRGPHLTHTGKMKAFAATRHSATNWLGDTDNDTLQRMYGISFPDKKQLKEWKENQEKAKERDHRRIMEVQKLVFFHDLTPGSAFWLPHGARIYNKLVDFVREFLWDNGYDEIITPNVFNLDLWHQSGHAQHYKENMFCFGVEGQEWAMKPMNCPSHCLMFASSIRSYRDLPIRYADFGVLHRNELSGALTGLTRVRRFQQDDGHIFCREDQIEEEVQGALRVVKEIYDIFGMDYKLELSTRPKKALGEIGLWNLAEAALAKSMDEFAGKGGWKVNPGDGAFYGPKIDIKVKDAMSRVHQVATIQLDFQLPIRFGLEYNTGSKEEGKQFTRPVLIHRAFLGSVERCFAILCEHYGGKWPFWLSPRQVMLVPVHLEFVDYCKEVRGKLHKKKFFVDVDESKNTFNKKVRNAQVAQYNYQLVVGKNEVSNGTVNIRTRDNEVVGEMKVEEMIEMLEKQRGEYSN